MVWLLRIFTRDGYLELADLPAQWDFIALLSSVCSVQMNIRFTLKMNNLLGNAESTEPKPRRPPDELKPDRVKTVKRWDSEDLREAKLRDKEIWDY